HLVLDDMPTADPLRGDLEEIRQAGTRAAALTRQLLAFGRRQMLQPQVVDLNGLVGQMDKLLRRLIGEDVELVTALSPDIVAVRVDPASIEQVLVNLAVNSRDAMPVGGRLTVETSMVDLDSAYASTHVTVAPGRYVMLAVSDTGQGMDAATRARVFEPFFTTKEPGKGTGLGLSTVYGIVNQSGGHIDVSSEVGIGTTFTIYLPRVGAAPSADVVGDAGAGPPPHGTETVLVVEDDEAVRQLALEILEAGGYTVLTAATPAQALALVEGSRSAIHLRLTDVVMPRMNGRALADDVKRRRVGLKVIFMSGYTADVIGPKGILDPGMTLIQKPFLPDVMLRTIRTVLDTPAPG